jgi:ferric enterobactin receptor
MMVLAAALMGCASQAQAQTATPPPPAPVPATATTTTPPTNVETVVITAKTDQRTSRIDRTVYDVSTRADAPLTPAVDVLGKLPGVFVGPNNRISMAGGAFVRVLVDGRPMQRDAALQIPADQIARVEVISNPSAQFSSGSQAIINIVTKKTLAASVLKGSVGLSSDSFESVSANVSLERGFGDWTLAGSLFGNVQPRQITYQSDFTYINPTGNVEEDNFGRAEFTPAWLAGRFRATRKIGEHDTLDIVYQPFTSKVRSDWVAEEIRRFGGTTARETRSNADRNLYNGNNFNLTYKSEKEENYKFETSLNFGDYREITRTRNELPRFTQLLDERSANNYLGYDISYEKTLPKDRVFTTGLEISSSNFELKFDGAGFVSPTTRQTNIFEASQTDYAAYITYQFKLGKLGILPGLRYESVVVDWTSDGAALSGRKSFDRLLPSLFLSHPLGPNGKIKASYSLGTTAYEVRQLNPFARYRNENSAQQGNPFLLPADRQTFELTYEYDKGDFSLVSTLFDRGVTDDIRDITRRGVGEVIITSPINLGSASATGVGATVKGKASAKFNYSFNFEAGINRFSLPSATGSETRQEDPFYNGKMVLEYKPNAANQFSLTTAYQSEIVQISGITGESWNNNFQYTRRLANRVSLVVNLIDVGVSPRTRSSSFGEGFFGSSVTEQSDTAVKVGLTKRF